MKNLIRLNFVIKINKRQKCHHLLQIITIGVQVRVTTKHLRQIQDPVDCHISQAHLIWEWKLPAQHSLWKGRVLALLNHLSIHLEESIVQCQESKKRVKWWIQIKDQTNLQVICQEQKLLRTMLLFLEEVRVQRQLACNSYLMLRIRDPISNLIQMLNLEAPWKIHRHQMEEFKITLPRD